MTNIFLPVRPNNVSYLELLSETVYKQNSKYYKPECYSGLDICQFDSNDRTIFLEEDSGTEIYDNVFLLESLDLKRSLSDDLSRDSKIIRNGKSIFPLFNKEDEWIKNELNVDVNYIKSDKIVNKIIERNNTAYSTVSDVFKPVIIVGSIISNSLKAELSVKIKEDLYLLGLAATIIGSHPIHSLLENRYLNYEDLEELNYTKKASLLSQYIKYIFCKDNCDVVIIEVPVTLMKYSNQYLGSMGEYMSILSSFLQQSYVIANTPLNFRFPEFSLGCRKLMQDRFGVTEVYCHYTNEYIFLGEFDINLNYDSTFVEVDKSYKDEHGHNVVHSFENATELRKVLAEWLQK